MCTHRCRMTGPQPPEILLAVPWGKVAALAGGVTVAWVTFRGCLAVGRMASREVQDRVLDGQWIARRG